MIGIRTLPRFLTIFIIIFIIGFVCILYKNFRAPFGQVQTKPMCKDCNVIFVSLDTLSANHLPCYGYDRNTSPNFCAFAKQHIMFTHAYSNGMYTFPSHVSMFTGLNPNIHKVNILYADSLSGTIPFLPQILQQNGYTTLFVLPNNDSSLPPATVYNRGISTLYLNGVGSWDQAMSDFAKNVDQKKKTFLFLHTYTVHTPYIPGNEPLLYATDRIPELPLTWDDYNRTSKKFYEKLYQTLQSSIRMEDHPEIIAVYKTMQSIIINNNYEPKRLDGIFFSETSPYNQYASSLQNQVNYSDHINVSNPRDVNYIRALYDQRIHDLDRDEISKVLRFLTSNKAVLRSTIVIFTADHGEEFMEHGEIYHKTIYDSNLHIPLVLYIPGIRNPEEITTPVQLTDLTPTILDMVGVSTPYDFQGNSLTGAISGTPLSDRLVVSDGYGLTTIAIRNTRWKLFAKRNADNTLTPYELYDLKSDPNEQHNVLFAHLSIALDFINRYLAFEYSWRIKTNYIANPVTSGPSRIPGK